MAETKNAAEVKRAHLEVLGEDLGPLYHALYEESTWLHAKWLEYRKLYAESPERIALLNEMAGFFFRIVQDVLWDDVILHLARLTAPLKSSGQPNLTLRRLAPAIHDPRLALDVGQLVTEAVAACECFAVWRNKRIAHRDLNLAIVSDVPPLQGNSRQQVELALASVAAVMNRVHEYYFDATVQFGRFVTHRGGEALIGQLQIARHADTWKRKRVEAGQPLPQGLEMWPRA